MFKFFTLEDFSIKTETGFTSTLKLIQAFSPSRIARVHTLTAKKFYVVLPVTCLLRVNYFSFELITVQNSSAKFVYSFAVCDLGNLEIYAKW